MDSFTIVGCLGDPAPSTIAESVVRAAAVVNASLACMKPKVTSRKHPVKAAGGCRNIE